MRLRRGSAPGPKELRRRTARRRCALRPSPAVTTLTAAVVAVVLLTAPGQAAPQRGAEGDARAGEAVYRQECAMCHGSDATGMMGMHPALRGAVDRLSVEGVEVAVRNGRSTTPPMPAFAERLSGEEIDDVIAYVAALPDGPRNFGPEGGEGMGSGMMGRMSGGGRGWMFGIFAVLGASVAGLIGYLVGSRRSRST